MDVRLLQDSEIPAAKALWKEAFDDSDVFIDWYFQNKVLPGNSLGMFDQGLISVLHMIPFQISVQGKPLSSALIAGAATAKQRRGQGLMRILLLEALSLMKRRNILMTHLYPFRHSFYENFGWTTYTYVHKKSVTKVKPQQVAQVIETTDYQVLNPLYQKMMRDFDGYVIRDLREWQWRLKELASDGGKAVVLMRNDVPSAYMLYYENGDRADVIETVFSDDSEIDALLAYILKQGYAYVDYFVPARTDEKPEKHGMARVVDAQALLEAFGAQDLLKYVNITDDFAKWNSIHTHTGCEIDISTLAKIIHQGTILHNLNDYAGNIEYNEWVKIFMPQNTCIFEAY